MAGFDIGLNIFFNALLILFLTNKFFIFIVIKMDYKKIVVMLANKFNLKNF